MTNGNMAVTMAIEKIGTLRVCKIYASKHPLIIPLIRNESFLSGPVLAHIAPPLVNL
jgi:hypothetical protein